MLCKRPAWLEKKGGEEQRMAGEEEFRESQRNSCQFEWDDLSQLYYHASSGFYHDPVAGWYYNTKDGSYYKFENGSYVLLESQGQADQHTATVSGESTQTDPCQGCVTDDDLQNPPPTSEWLEETLIDLYLAGYSNSATNATDDTLVVTTDADLAHGAEVDSMHEIEHGEWVEEDSNYANKPSERISDEGVSWEEENWRAQYGQVVQSAEEVVPASSVIDLWDWAMTTETVAKKKRGKKQNCQIAKLTGKLVKPSAKLHPSMPSSVPIHKTAAICEANFALVRVSSGQIYRLKSPSLKYLSSLSTYDSSNPTKDWGFPDLSNDKQSNFVPNSCECCNKETGSTELPDPLMTLEKNKGPVYRDRAAERRILHGGYGVGPGQKNQGRDCGQETSPVSISTEEAAAEALHMSFGAGSYARRILENMGWKEGEALGKTSEGLRQPLEAVGNKGFAGLGWDMHRPSNR